MSAPLILAEAVTAFATCVLEVLQAPQGCYESRARAGTTTATIAAAVAVAVVEAATVAVTFAAAATVTGTATNRVIPILGAGQIRAPHRHSDLLSITRGHVQ